MKKIELNSLNLEESKEYMISIGEKAYRGDQLFSYFNRNKELDIDKIEVLSKKIRNKLIENGKVNQIKVLEKFESKLDNTKKYLFLFFIILKKSLSS